MSASPRDAPPESDSLAAVDALSPLDGRYRTATASLRNYDGKIGFTLAQGQ